MTDLNKAGETASRYFNVAMKDKLGQGSYGRVWGVDSKTPSVLKVTTSQAEAKAIQAIMGLRRLGEFLPAFPEYYGICKVGDCFAILRERASCPCILDFKYVESFQYVACNSKYETYKKDLTLKWFKYIYDSFDALRKRSICLSDIRMDNVGHTMSDNQYRRAGDPVLFDFQPYDSNVFLTTTDLEDRLDSIGE